MAEVKIPESIIDQFKNPGDLSKNNSGGAGDEVAIKSLEQSIGWLCSIADKYMKQNELSGFGEIGSDDYAKMTSIMLKEEFPKLVADKSAKNVWGLATLGLVGINYLDFVAKQKRENEAKKTGENE